MRQTTDTGRSREACWRFVIQYGLKEKLDHRRWTEDEIDLVREELVRCSVNEIARKLKRTPTSVRCMLQRNGLHVREIRSDLFSVESLSRALHVRKSETLFWIEQGWLQASVKKPGKRNFYEITAESLLSLYKRHLSDLLKRRLPNQCLFEAYVQYCHSPKHTVGEQLLEVRRDKRERAAYAALQPKQTGNRGGGQDRLSAFASLRVGPA
jgi:hypothetical protein